MTPWVKVVQHEAWVTKRKGKENYCTHMLQSEGRPHSGLEAQTHKQPFWAENKKQKCLLRLKSDRDILLC